MAYTGLLANDPFALPKTIDPAGSLTELNPLPPPGRAADGTSDLHPLLTGHYAAVNHVYTSLIADTITNLEVWTWTITPTKTVNGLPIADDLGAVTLSVIVDATATATALALQVIAAYVTASTVTTVAGVDSTTRIDEIVALPTSVAGTVTWTSANAGTTFTVTSTQEAGGTSTNTNTVDASGVDMRIGVFVAKSGTMSAGGVPNIRILTTGDTAADIYGIVGDGGTRVKAIDSAAGYAARYYAPGRDIPILPLSGHWTALAEAAVDYDDGVWVRVVATGAEIAGAANDTPDDVKHVITCTPTAANTTLYEGAVAVYDELGRKVAETQYSYTSDGSGTATEIVTGMAVDVDAGAVIAYLTRTGTATMILTSSVAGYTISVNNSGAGVISPVETTAVSNDHVKLASAKFSRSITAAGTSAIQF